VSYAPVIAFMGKTGVGKSSTCNALFGEEMFKVGAVSATTRAAQLEELDLGDRSMALVDLPGIGESMTFQKRYRDLYLNVLGRGIKVKGSKQRRPVDAICWLLKADDRALEVEVKFFKAILKKALAPAELKRIVFAINQADKMEPTGPDGGWDYGANAPGPKQSKNLDEKLRVVAKAFGVSPDRFVVFSATTGYNMAPLLDAIVQALPPERVPFVVAKALAQEARTGRRIVSSHSRQRANQSFWDLVVEAAQEIGSAVVKAVKAVSIVKSAWGLLKSLFS
jgi:predicted GTPase